MGAIHLEKHDRQGDRKWQRRVAAWVAVGWARLAAGVAWQGSAESGRGSVAAQEAAGVA